MNSLLSFLLPDGEFKSFGTNSEEHNEVYEDVVKPYLEKKNIFSRFKRDDMFFPKAVGLSAFDSVISICNSTINNVNNSCKSLLIYSPKYLTDEQNDVMLQLYEQHLKFIDDITIALIDNNCNISSCKLDDYVAGLNFVAGKSKSLQ